MINEKEIAIIIGVGQLGSDLASLLDKSNYKIIKVNRSDDLHSIASQYPQPQLVIIATGEIDLDRVLVNFPDLWKDRVVLLQNELVPYMWMKHEIYQPTVLIIWFEKKTGLPRRIILPSRVSGPLSTQMSDAFKQEQIPIEIISPEVLSTELVAKNMYILVTNIAGLCGIETAGELLEVNKQLFDILWKDIWTVQKVLFNHEVDENEAKARTIEAMSADPEHKNQGRTASIRYERLRAVGKQLNINIDDIEQYKKA